MVAERLPKQGIGYFTDEGYLNYGYNDTERRMLWTCYNDGYEEHPTWWLEEIELPSDYDIDQNGFHDKHSNKLFTEGANYILNKLKGGSR